MRSRDKPPQDPQAGELKPDLADVLEKVGPTRYARATAHLFEQGGKYAPRKPRRRYAIT